MATPPNPTEIEQRLSKQKLKGRAAADVAAAISRVQDSIQRLYPEAQFQIDQIDEHEVHLLAFTREDHDRELMQLANDEVDALQRLHGVYFCLVPLLLGES